MNGKTDLAKSLYIAWWLSPWQRVGSVPPEFAPPVERTLARQLWRRMLDDSIFRYQVILGPRRVGKTTVLYQTVRHLINDGGVDPTRIWWVPLDHPMLRGESLGDMVQMILRQPSSEPEEPVYLMLDEVGYAEDWDLWLKTFYDQRWPVRIVASSSTAAIPKGRHYESGIGRWAEQWLTTYLFSEFLDMAEGLANYPDPIVGPSSVILPGAWRRVEELEELREFRSRIQVGESLAETLLGFPWTGANLRLLEEMRLEFAKTGGFPGMLVDLNKQGLDIQHHVLRSQERLRSEVVVGAIYKDMPETLGANKPQVLEHLLYILADQTAEILSPSKICQDLGITNPTLERYLAILGQAFLVFTLTNFSRGGASSTRKRGRKTYLVDCALRSVALQRELMPVDELNVMGIPLENLVASSLHALAVQSGARLHHWRDGDFAVDFVYDHPLCSLAFEVGMTPSHRYSGLRALMERHKKFRGGCYIVAPQAPVVRPDESTIGTLPLELLLLAVGAQAEHDLKKRMGIDPTNGG